MPQSVKLQTAPSSHRSSAHLELLGDVQHGALRESRARRPRAERPRHGLPVLGIEVLGPGDVVDRHEFRAELARTRRAPSGVLRAGPVTSAPPAPQSAAPAAVRARRAPGPPRARARRPARPTSGDAAATSMARSSWPSASASSSGPSWSPRSRRPPPPPAARAEQHLGNVQHERRESSATWRAKATRPAVPRSGAARGAGPSDRPRSGAAPARPQARQRRDPLRPAAVSLHLAAFRCAPLRSMRYQLSKCTGFRHWSVVERIYSGSGSSREDALDCAPVTESRALRLVDGTGNALERSGVQRDAAEPLQVVADPVAAELEAALALRRSGADPKALRRALRRIEELLDE